MPIAEVLILGCRGTHPKNEICHYDRIQFYYYSIPNLVPKKLRSIAFVLGRVYYSSGFCRTVCASEGEKVDQQNTIYDWKINFLCDKQDTAQ